MWYFLAMKYVALLFVILNCSGCQPVEHEEYTNARGLESLDWGPRIQSLGALHFSGNETPSSLRGKRLINLADLAKNEQKPNKAYQACIAPGNKNGHCRHLSTCVLDVFRSNFTRFMDYMCIIDSSFVGVCCPDQGVVPQADSSVAESLAGVLPAVAAADDDKPIWGEAKGSNEDDLQPAATDEAVPSKVQNGPRKAKGPRGCGVSTKSRTRIVGGRPADPREWPWMAALLRDDSTQYCGGVLVTDRHVLTAAHCVYRYKAREIRVRLGEYDFTRPEETRALDFRVAEIRQHLDFDPATYENDVAIVKIHRPTIFNSYIWPVCLPPVGMSFVNKTAVVTGWGTQYFGGPVSPVLMEVAIPVWPQDRCIRSFTQNIPNTVLCAGGYEGGRDSCQGDSGGPLLHQLGNGRWVNIGIVSWGIRCGEPGLPGVYTRVNSYLDWIFDNAVF